VQVAVVRAAAVAAQKPDVNVITTFSFFGGVHRLMNVPDEVHDEFQCLCPLFPRRLLVREHFYKVADFFDHATPWRRTIPDGFICAPERNIYVMPRRSVPALSTDVISPRCNGVQVIVTNERLDHHSCGFVQMILGNRADDLVSFTAPTEAKARYESDNGEDQRDFAHENLNGIVAEFGKKWNQQADRR
jgi:hypothetical protein